MKWNRFVSVMAALVLAFGTAAQADVITHGGTTITMEFVTVGNAGNGNDTHDTGYGAVGYNYRIGKYEVTAAQWAAVIAADANVGNAGYWTGSQPTANTSWHEAAKFCNWLTTGSANSGYYAIADGLATPNTLNHDAYAALHGTTYFIPTENEWYKAAYYDPNKSGAGVGGYWDYPTNHDSPNVPDGIDFAGDTAFDAVFSQGYEQRQPHNVDNTGVLSAYGTMGQGGNVWEWNEAVIGSESRGLRGGNYRDGSGYLLASGRDHDSAAREFVTMGMRVASVPEPGSLTLMLCGAIAGLLWWNRKRT